MILERTNHPLLRDIERELIFSLVTQLTQLHAAHLGTDVSGQIIHLRFAQELRERGICVFAVFIVYERLERRIPSWS